MTTLIDLKETILNGVLDVKIKKLNENAVIPYYATWGDAAMDITATSIDVTEDYINYGTGLSFEIPEGYMMLIFPRSSNCKKDLLQTNAVGILDSGYRGELMVRFKRISEDTFGETISFVSSKIYNIGDRIAQIMILPYPTINFIEVDELSETQRGTGGFGHTGN